MPGITGILRVVLGIKNHYYLRFADKDKRDRSSTGPASQRYEKAMPGFQSPQSGHCSPGKKEWEARIATLRKHSLEYGSQGDILDILFAPSCSSFPCFLIHAWVRSGERQKVMPQDSVQPGDAWQTSYGAWSQAQLWTYWLNTKTGVIFDMHF